MTSFKNFEPLRLYLSFFTLLCLSPLCLSASKNPTSVPIKRINSEEQASLEKAIVEAIVRDLSGGSYKLPFKGEYQYAYSGLEQGPTNDIHLALGRIIQGDDVYYCLFSAVKDNAGWIKTNLIYLSTDIPISFRLYADVLRASVAFWKKDQTSRRVLIEKQERPQRQKKSKLQKWTFFEESKSAEFYVLLTEDGKGGNYFEISQKPL